VESFECNGRRAHFWRAFSSGAFARNSSNIGALDDVRITADVQGAIAQRRELAPNQIQVDTRDHVVYLSGMVYSALIGDDATETARKVPGVIES
jgi:osmotically-inducible protein OsmY